jgi:hypothetical protein
LQILEQKQMVDIHNNIDFDWIYNSVTHIWCHCSNLIWIQCVSS